MTYKGSPQTVSSDTPHVGISCQLGVQTEHPTLHDTIARAVRLLMTKMKLASGKHSPITSAPPESSIARHGDCALL